HFLDGARGVALVRSDDPGGPALDPSRNVDEGHELPVAQHATLRVRHDALLLVEGEPGDRNPTVADGAEDQPGLYRLDPAGATRRGASLVVLDQLVVFDREPRDLAAVADDLRRRRQEAEDRP